MSITTTTSSPFVKARSVGLTEARWTGGFWSDRFDVCSKTMVPTMHRLMTNSERQRFLGNFEVASGDADGRHRGPKWNDGDFYKWLESAAAVYWTAAALRGAGYSSAAWDAATSGWVRARLAGERAAMLRADLDKLVLQGVIPDRVRLLPPLERAAAESQLRADWELIKERWR